MSNAAFWRKFVFLCLCLIFLDLVIGKSLEFLYYNQKNGKLHNLIVGLERQQCDVLIFGSSRAMHHYNPDILSDSLMMSCYNVGYDSQSILYHNALLDVILERYSPKMIILDIRIGEFGFSQESYDLLSILNPFVDDHPVLWNTLSLISPFEKIKHLSSIYPYNSDFLRIVAGNINRTGKDVSDNGFTAHDGIWKAPISDKSFPKELKMDPNKLASFDAFCQKCIKHNIELFFVFSPTFAYINDNDSEDFRQIIEKSDYDDIPFINYSNDPAYRDNNLFMDPDHLNREGSAIFSKDISHKILTIKKRI